MSIATFIIFLLGFLILNAFSPLLPTLSFLPKLIFIVISFLVLILIYIGLAFTLRVEEAEIVLKEIKNKLSL